MKVKIALLSLGNYIQYVQVTVTSPPVSILFTTSLPDLLRQFLRVIKNA